MAVKPGNGGAGGGERDPRLDLLYRDTPREAPPPRLDAAILAAARREVGARPRPRSAQFRRWRVPVSIAAVVVLSVSLVTLVREEGGDTLLRDGSAPVPQAAQTTESPRQPTEDRQRAPAAAPEVSSARRDERVTAKASAEPERMEREATPAAGPSAEQSRNAIAGAAPKMSSPEAREFVARPSADQSRQEAPSMAGQRSTPQAAAPAPAPVPPAERRLQAEPLLAMKRAPVWHGLEQEPPGKWLERLAELRKKGRTGEADELLAEIKRRFPDQPLPTGVE